MAAVGGPGSLAARRRWISELLLYPLFITPDPGEDGAAAHRDELSVCQRPCEKRSTMLRRVEGFK